jgi:hypothetical protein
MSGELAEGLGDILAQLGVSQTAVEDTLGTVTPMANQGLDQALAETHGQSDGIAGESSGTLATIQAMVHGALDAALGRFTGLARLATAKATAALGLGAAERTRPIAAAEAQVMQTLEGVPDDPTGEIDADLARIARELADRFGSAAEFATGSFLPAGYRWKSDTGDRRLGTIGQGMSGYQILRQPLEDFDVVFGYPWGGEEVIMHDVMRRYGSKDAHLLLQGTNGVEIYRDGKRVN